MENKIKLKAAILSVLSNSTLIILKIIVGSMANSFSIISEALHSSIDLIASLVSFWAVKNSSKPADKDHAFGHGKFEDFSGLIEGILIILASFYIAFEAIIKIVNNSTKEIDVNLAIYIMLFSIFINFFVTKYLFNCSKKTNSIALFADAQHLKSDIYSSLGILMGLFLIKITNISLLDPIIALFVSAMIWHCGYKICKKTYADLLDSSLTAEEENEIIETINKIETGHIFRVCKMKSRRSGPNKIIELVICVDENMTVKISHNLCNEIENLLKRDIGNIDCAIHIEPICRDCKKKLENLT